jgi:hypothetical protein
MVVSLLPLPSIAKKATAATLSSPFFFFFLEGNEGDGNLFVLFCYSKKKKKVTAASLRLPSFLVFFLEHRRGQQLPCPSVRFVLLQQEEEGDTTVAFFFFFLH